MSRRAPRRRVTAGAFVLAVVAALLPLAPRAAAPPADTGDSLRILNYNTGFLWLDLPFPCGSFDLNDGKFGGLDYDDRANAIADAILATDNDIVVLNEVFSPDVADIFVSRLKGAYPNYVSEIADSRSVTIATAVIYPVLPAVPDACAPLLLNQPAVTMSSAGSGLMIFLRNGLEFAPLKSPHPKDAHEIEGGGPTWNEDTTIAVDTYAFDVDLGMLDPGECYGVDCFATKAAALVRVNNKATGRRSGVAFSHMQAQGGPDEVKAREVQFDVMRRLILGSLTFSQTREPLYVVGDLNVPGENKATNTGGSEWTKLFKSSASTSKAFFACGLGPCTHTSANPFGSLLTDGWGFETSTGDKGITNAEDNARLDYVLNNHAVTAATDLPRCLQHIMRGYDLEEGAGPLSDHLGMRADVNRRAAQCSPNDDAGAFGPKPIALDVNGQLKAPGTITFKGSMQWFRLDPGVGWGTGSYQFGADTGTANVDLDVYAASDLSQPIPMFEEVDSGRFKKYVLPEPPYYIRVYATDAAGKPDRTVTGSYTFRVKENRGLTPTDAMGLQPGYPGRYDWPFVPLNGSSGTKGNTTFLPDTKVWYSFYTDTSSGGAFPKVDFLSENSQNLDQGVGKPFQMVLRADAAGFPVIPAAGLDQSPGSNGNFVHDFDVDGHPDHRLRAPNLKGVANGGPQRFFLTVQRMSPEAQIVDVSSWTTFRTTLTYVKSLELFIEEEVTWGPGDDSTTFQWAYDVPGTATCQTVTGAVCHGPVALNDGYRWEPAAPSFNGSFANRLTPRLWEAGDHLTARREWDGPGYTRIGALSPGDTELHRYAGYVVWDGFIWATANNPGDSVYWYQYKYCLGHIAGEVENCGLTE